MSSTMSVEEDALAQWARNIRETKQPHKPWVAGGGLTKETSNVWWTQADSFSHSMKGVERVCIQTWKYPAKEPIDTLEFRGFAPSSAGGMIVPILGEAPLPIPKVPNVCTSSLTVNWKPDEKQTVRALWVLNVAPSAPVRGGVIA